MTQQKKIIAGLTENLESISSLLQQSDVERRTWKDRDDRWCLLEILCHLYDEEREDFRPRIRHILEGKAGRFTPINPAVWVNERNYLGQDFDDKLQGWIKERENSIQWLESLGNPAWDRYYTHETLGKMTAGMLLSNWLAHDFLHLRQILKLKFDYLRDLSGEELNYAGNW